MAASLALGSGAPLKARHGKQVDIEVKPSMPGGLRIAVRGVGAEGIPIVIRDAAAKW